MILRKWSDLPDELKTEAVRPYYDILMKHRVALALKRGFDVGLSSLLIILTSPLMLLAAIAVKLDSKGPVIYKQERITQYGKRFNICKMRTMVEDADKHGSLVTIRSDCRITRVGKVLRKIKADEFPQLFNVWLGDMSFVGTRPEVEKYVSRYTDDMNATLLLPAGITSKASIKYRDEERILEGSTDIDSDYIKKVLPGKMKYNLEYLRYAGFWYDLSLVIKTGWLVIQRVFAKRDIGDELSKIEVSSISRK